MTPSRRHDALPTCPGKAGWASINSDWAAR